MSWVGIRTLSVVRNDGDEIVGNDCHIMTVDGELLHPFGTTIDQAQSMDFPRRKSEVCNACIAVTFGFVASSHQRAVVIIASLNQVRI